MKIYKTEDTPLGERIKTTFELPEKLLPFTRTAIDPVNGKTYLYVTNEEYARQLGKRVSPVAGTNSTKGPTAWSWDVA